MLGSLLAIWPLIAASVMMAAANASQAHAGSFVFDEATNAEMTKKLRIPVYFAVPASARAPLPNEIEIPDQLIDFRHPDAAGSEVGVGLRMVVSDRKGFAERIGKSGLIQTGDILLTFRAEWADTGAYPNINMGISHASIAFVKDNVAHHLDNPMDTATLGDGLVGNFTGDHYRLLNYFHVIRPRSLTESQRTNLLGWTDRLRENASKIYPHQLQFNSDYGAPKYRRGVAPEFVRHLGRMALGKSSRGKFDLYCSEFVWTVLALRNCDPAVSEGDFEREHMPTCIASAMEPMSATRGRGGLGDRESAGFLDGPRLVLDSLGLDNEVKDQLYSGIFRQDLRNLTRLSAGHRAVVSQINPTYAPLEHYFKGFYGSARQRVRSRIVGKIAQRELLPNYSPTTYLINTLLPVDHPQRTMDYVVTIMLAGSLSSEPDLDPDAASSEIEADDTQAGERYP